MEELVTVKTVKRNRIQKNRLESKSIPEDPFKNHYGDSIIEPQFDPCWLAELIETSNILPQCIDAMKQNCEGFGYTLIDKVKDDDKTESIQAAIDKEKEFMNNFFEYISYNMSFEELRKEHRDDLESYGYSFIEILENAKGDPDGFEYIDAMYMRLCQLSGLIDVRVKKRVAGSYDYVEVDYKRRFRMFVQMIGVEKVYFKEYGDPRSIDCKTGLEVSKEDLLKAKETGEDIQLASSIVYFKLSSRKTPYGVPRWVGNTPSVTGSRAAEEINYGFFNNSGIPPKMIAVTGSTLGKKGEKVIEDFFKYDLKGSDRLNQVLIISAVGKDSPHNVDGTGKVGIEVIDLMNIEEGRFMEYDEKARKKIRSSFRIGPLFTGETEDYTYATAKESKRTAEEQVFSPEKADFDYFINRRIFPDLGIKYIKFKTKSAPIEDRKELGDLVKILNDSGLTNFESRKIIDSITDVEMEELDPDDPKNGWLNAPMKIAQFVMAQALKQQQQAPGAPEQSPEEKAAMLKQSFINGMVEMSKELKRGIAE